MSDLPIERARAEGMKQLATYGKQSDPVWVNDLNKAIDATYAKGLTLANDPAGRVSIEATGFPQFWPNSYARIGAGLEKEGLYFRAKSSESAAVDVSTPGANKVAIPPPAPSKIADTINKLTAGLSSGAKSVFEANARYRWAKNQPVYVPANRAGFNPTTGIVLIAALVAVGIAGFVIWKGRD